MTTTQTTPHLRLLTPTTGPTTPADNRNAMLTTNATDRSNEPRLSANDDDTEGVLAHQAGSHIAVVWHPDPLRVWAEVDPGDDWHAAITDAVLTAYRDEADLLQPWFVEFHQHTVPDTPTCSPCADLRAEGGSASVGMVDEDYSVIDVLTAHDAGNGTPPPAGHESASNRWSGPAGEISWGIKDLVITAVVSNEDWLTPLTEAYLDFVRAQLPHITFADLEFGG